MLVMPPRKQKPQRLTLYLSRISNRSRALRSREMIGVTWMLP